MPLPPLWHDLKNVENAPAVWLTGPDAMKQEVAGEAYARTHLELLLRAHGEGRQLVAWLVPEPTNATDPNAVMVWVGGGRVGYLPRRDAEQWQPVICSFIAHYRANCACSAELITPTGGEVMASVPIEVLVHLTPLRGTAAAGAYEPHPRSQAFLDPGGAAARFEQKVERAIDPRDGTANLELFDVLMEARCPRCRRPTRVSVRELSIEGGYACGCAGKLQMDPRDLRTVAKDLRELASKMWGATRKRKA